MNQLRRKLDVRYRLSFSTMETLHSCERKYQLRKRLAAEYERDETEHTVFGRSYGEGVQEYFRTQDAEAALAKAWLAYYPELETQAKNLPRVIVALERTFPLLDSLLLEWELLYLPSGRSATELSFCLYLEDPWYFVGYMDAVLRHRTSGLCAVLECKTTGLLLHDLDPLYKNSPQGLGYSIVLDSIVGQAQSDYSVTYLAMQLGRNFADVNPRLFNYPKNLMDRYRWFITLGLDIKHLNLMEELNIYPQRGTSCLAFNKPCQHFGVCGLTSFDHPAPAELDDTEYDFYFSLDSLIADHLTRLEV